MIRFFDREVFYAAYETLDKNELLTSFSRIHLDSAACVVDKNGKYKGEIFYRGLLEASEPLEAIRTDYIILDDHVWENARQYFANSERRTVAVIDKNGQLVSHAYDEPASNREMRMLHELMTNSKAIQFSDVFPEYQCVKIYECNELAYSFVQYLKNCNIQVYVYGKLWDFFSITERNEEKENIPDYACLNIFSEGIWQKGRDWSENLLRSVSVEFECVDQIYEANIKAGIVQDALGNDKKLLEALKAQSEIIIIGSGLPAQDTYDYLTGKGVEVCCFADNDRHKCNYSLLGKRIVRESEAVKKYKNAFFLECTSQNSAWNELADYYDYMGYGRNKKFFMVRDYIEVQGNNLFNVLRNRKVVLTGNVSLCRLLLEYLRKSGIAVLGYLESLELGADDLDLNRIQADEIDEECVCLIAAYDFFDLDGKHRENVREKIKQRLKEMGVENYTDYFCDMRSYIDFEQKISVKYSQKQFMPKQIIIGASESCSGNIFFRELLDGHPSISMITDYSFWNNNLFWICICLSGMKSEKILPFFWAWYKAENQEGIFNPSAFHEKMQQLLMCGERFTSQELFVMFHIAYEYMYGRNIADVQNLIIYWEPHIFPRGRVEECVRWLQSETVGCEIVNVVRNICPLKGSALKGRVLLGWSMNQTLSRYFIDMWNYPSVAKKEFDGIERTVIKFEELKSRPREILQELCCKWDIEWSDALMKTTKHGQASSYDNGHRIINDFDMTPVYNMYEEYFSEFDRVRMVMIDALWQRKYGYPYEKITRFSRRELQEMFLKEFRFENLQKFNSEREKLTYRILLLNMFRRKLWEVRRLEIIDND